ncbi:MAG: thiosulfate oxidation carrier complex protein SoxZ [Thiohalocapsa sp.]|jgi:hypothetical protein
MPALAARVSIRVKLGHGENLIAFHIQQGQAGDTVVIRWVDNQGETASLEAQVV